MLDLLWGLTGGFLTGDSPGWVAGVASAAVGGGGALLLRLGARAAVVAAAALGIVVYVGWTQAALSSRRADVVAAEARAAKLSGELDQAVEVNATNARLADERARQNARDMTDVAARLRRAEARAAALTRRISENERDPDARRSTADACPALDRWLDRLWHDARPALDRPDGHRPATRSGPVDDVPGSPTPAVRPIPGG